MSALEDAKQGETRPAGIGPGERLQAARIQMGLSLEDVAERMHLSPGILEALEENNFEEITAPIFVKGYLRAYARIVSLDEDEMIQQYMDYYSEEDPPITSTSNMAPELSVTDARIKWTTYFVIVVLAALLGAWWWNKEKAEETSISLDAQPAETQAADGGDGELASSAIEAVSEAAVEPEIESVVEAEMESLAEAEATEAAAAADAATPEPLPAPAPSAADDEPALAAIETQAPAASDEPPAAPAAEESVAAQAPEAAPAVVPPAAAPIAPGGTDRLLIIVNADTWADIKDDSDFQLVYDLLRADQTLELVGSAPFSVFLGNGHGVEIRFNGEDISFSNRIRDDNTARLKIGG